jgi:8-oxo-dGTP pyrophosphatase MutT (NUDIX family)
VSEEVPVRDAATVVLLRDGAAGPDVWLLTRIPQLAFAAGMAVFPGGRAEPADEQLPFSGAGLPQVAARFGCDEGRARRLLGAAVRETYEEAGVLLTTPPAELPELHREVEAGRLSFGDLLREHGLAIDTEALRPWARWVTPRQEKRRYDTHFFVAALPEGAVAQDVTTESSTADWIAVGEVVEQVQRGERRMLPPTMATLVSLARYGRVADALAAAPDQVVEAVRPVLRQVDGGVVAELPDGTSWPVPT